ncbi:MAG: hypothetical protein LJE83_07180, partial [Gammaproteobacteria bacterium]|nr:hypothetical protein [Gammaproteobacteria bacterium]
MKKQFNLLATAIFSILAAHSAQAIQFDGFVTAGASVHDDSKNKNTYIGGLGDRGITNDVTFETDTRFGLQISSDVTEDMSVVAQLLGTGVDGNFNAIIEWAYVDYALNDIASIHVGKIKQPVYLVNDYIEVGYAYPWIRPPVEVYYLNNPLNTVNGIEFLLQFPVGPGTLSFQPYVGSNRDDIPNTQGAYFEAENIYGIDVKYSGHGYIVHASTFQCEVKTYGGGLQQITFPGDSTPTDVRLDLNGTGDCEVTSAGFNLDMANVVVYAEWQDRTTTDTLSRAFGDQDAYYATIGYRFGKFLPHLTYASIDGKASTVLGSDGRGAATIEDGSGSYYTPGVAVQTFNFPVAIQTSITAGLRYEVNDSAALKIEYSVVDVENDTSKLADANQGTNYGLFNTDFSKMPPDGS